MEGRQFLNNRGVRVLKTVYEALQRLKFEIVQILRDFIKSIRTGNWSLHLQSSQRMLSWFLAYDRINYARHFTYCWTMQTKLPDKHSRVHQRFLCGLFSTKRATGNFNMLPPDQVIEQTINREQKGSGGIIGISTTSGAVQRWVLSTHIIAELTGDLKSSLGLEIVNKQKRSWTETKSLR